MIPSENECKELISKFKNQKIDVVATIQNTVKSGMIDESFYVSTDDAFPLSEYCEDVEFGSDEYFNKVKAIVNGDDEYYRGVYISLCFVSEESFRDDNPIKFKVDGLNEDDVVAQGFDTYKNHADLLLPMKCMFYGEGDDFGVFVSKDEHGFYWKGELGGHGGFPMLTNIEGFLEEPVHRLAVKLVYDAVVFS